MGDIGGSNNNDLIEANIDLKIKHYEIILNEKRNQIQQLNATIDRLKSVELKRYELAKDFALKEIQQIEEDLKNLKVQVNSIDASKQ